MNAPRRRLLDSWAVLALLNDEDGADAVAEHLRTAQDEGDSLLINEINVGEIYCIIAKHRSTEAAERTLDHLATLPIEIVGNTFEQVLDAARVKAAYRVSCADAFAVSTAARLDATVLTGDPEFEAVRGVVEIEWLQ